MEVFAVLLGIAVFAILFIVPFVVLGRLSGLREEVEELNRKINSLHLLLREKAVKPAGHQPEPAAALKPIVPSPTSVPEPPPTPAPVVAMASESAPSAPPAMPRPPSPSLNVEPSEPPPPSAADQVLGAIWNWLVIGEAYRKPGTSWEYAVATNWLLRIGIVTVLGGVAFFLKYSIEKGLLGPLGRVSLSVVAGLALIVFGVRLLFRRYHLLGQGLAGAGFVTLYFAFYAASPLYHLIGQASAFVLMACVTVTAGALAVLYRTPMIAVLGSVGGYATPMMLSQGGGNELFFYGYVLLLGVGVLGVSLVRRWPALNVLGMVAAYGLAFSYCSHHHGASYALRGLIFLSAVHLLYLLSVVLVNLRLRLRTAVVEWLAILFNAGLYWCWVLILFKPAFGKAETGLVALAMTAVYVALLYVGLARKTDDRTFLDLLLALSAVFLAMSPVLLLPGEWLTLAWCLQALTMVWIARRSGNNLLEVLALILFAWATIRGLAFDLHRLYGVHAPQTLKGLAFWQSAGVRLLSFGALPATLLTARWLKRADAFLAALWRPVLALALAQVWLYVTLESGLIARVYAPAFRHGAVTVVWTFFAFGLLFWGIRLRGPWLRGFGLALFALAVGKLMLVDLAGLETLYRIVAFISVGVLLVLGSFVYLKYRSLFEPDPEQADHA